MRIETWFGGNTFVKKEELKAIGAKWDREQKVWYMNELPAVDIEGVERHIKIYIASESEIGEAIEIISKDYDTHKQKMSKAPVVAARISPDITKMSKEEMSKLRKAIRSEISKLF